jgi:transcriptional regulator GlxA family with amidase domain
MRGREQNGRHTESKRLECVLEHIRVNLNEPPDYRRLAKLANISYCQLFREFKRCLGVSPQQYIEHQRIAYAKRLLAADRLSVKEVALQSGYKNRLTRVTSRHSTIRWLTRVTSRHSTIRSHIISPNAFGLGRAPGLP